MQAILWVVLLAGCGGKGDGGKDGNPDPNPEDQPSIQITSPVDGTGSYGDFTVAWQLQNFVLGAEGKVQVLVDGDIVGESTALTYTLTGLASGPHTVEAVLAGMDGASLGVSDSVSLDVLHPTVTIGSPVVPPIGSYAGLPLTLIDFTLDPAPDGAPAFGVGHYALSVDGAPWDWSADPLVAGFSRLPAGTHTLQVELVGNDGLPLAPAVVSNTLSVDTPALGPYVAFDHATFAGEAWPSAAVPLQISVANFDLGGSGGTGDTAAPPAATGGWYHLYIDALWGDSATETSRPIDHLAPGWHTFDVVLVDGLSGWEMPVRDSLRVQVAADRADVVIVDPGDGYNVHPSFSLTVSPENFTLAPGSMGGANVDGEGHYTVSIDSGLPVASAASVSSVTGLSGGAHSIRVALANNDGTALVPAVYDEIIVNVTLP